MTQPASETMLSEMMSVKAFTFSETARRYGLDNSIAPEHMENAKFTASMYDRICKNLKRTLSKNSCYRGRLLNKAVNGVSTSYHCLGLSMDLDDDETYDKPQMSDLELAKAIAAMEDVPYDKVILEYGWVHVQFAKKGEKPRRQTFTIKKAGAAAIVGLHA